jgi:hypothetical protein
MDRILAIDPMALLLREDIYVKLHLPYPPPGDVVGTEIREIVKTMQPEARKQALTRVKALGAYVNMLQKELAGAEMVSKSRAK